MKRERKAASAEHKKYLKRLRRENGLVQILRFGLLLALLGVWELVARTGKEAQSGIHRAV